MCDVWYKLLDQVSGDNKCDTCRYFDRKVWDENKAKGVYEAIAGARACLRGQIATDGLNGVRKIACIGYEPKPCEE